MKEKLHYVLNPDNASDCSFLLDGPNEEHVEVYSYKWILSQVSPVFSAMFNGDFKESTVSFKIPIKDIELHVFQTFLNNIYGICQCEHYSVELLHDLLILSDRYDVQSSSQLYKDAFRSKISTGYYNIDDVINAVKWINDFVKVDKLNLLNRIILKLRYSSKTEFLNVKCKYLKQLTLSQFYEFIELLHQYNKIDHIKIFKFVDAYVGCYKMENKNSVALESVKKSLLFLIKFEEMNLQMFFDGPVNSDLLSLEEKLHYIKRIALKT